VAFEDIKDQIKDRLIELRGKIEENPAFNTLRERYEILSPNAQFGVKAGAAVFVLLLLIYFPYSFFSASNDNVALFNEKRTLIRKLLRASRTATEGGNVENPPTAGQLIENVRGDLSSFSLLPEQIGDISVLAPDALGGRYAPNNEIEQEGIGINLKKLNLKQVLEIGHRLQNGAQGVRLVGLEVRAGSPDPHYFDVLYKLARFSLPMPSEAAAGKGNAPPRNRPGRPSNNPQDEEEEE
jgi:hypothetical protein